MAATWRWELVVSLASLLYFFFVVMRKPGPLESDGAFISYCYVAVPITVLVVFALSKSIQIIDSEATALLRSLYYVASLAGILNTGMTAFAAIQYYTTCGTGRHSCSLFKDLTVNVATQIVFADFIISSLLTIIFFWREEIRNARVSARHRLNAWQFTTYAILGSPAFGLGQYFIATLASRPPTWIRKISSDEHDNANGKQIVIEARKRLEKNYVPRERTNISKDFTSILVALYMVLTFFSLLVSVQVADVKIIDHYTNIANKFMTNYKLLLWLQISLHAISTSLEDVFHLSTSHLFAFVMLFLPFSSVSLAMGVFLLWWEIKKAKFIEAEGLHCLFEACHGTSEAEESIGNSIVENFNDCSSEDLCLDLHDYTPHAAFLPERSGSLLGGSAPVTLQFHGLSALNKGSGRGKFLK